ncbi:MAG: hypothetical protein Q9197_004243 [Variospora fuerteventurae]
MVDDDEDCKLPVDDSRDGAREWKEEGGEGGHEEQSTVLVAVDVNVGLFALIPISAAGCEDCMTDDDDDDDTATGATVEVEDDDPLPDELIIIIFDPDEVEDMAVVVEAVVEAAGGDEYAADMLDQERIVDAAAVASTPTAFTSTFLDLGTALLAMATAEAEALEVPLTEAEVEDIAAEDSAHTFAILGSMEIAMREDEGMDPLDEPWDGMVDDMEATKTGVEVDGLKAGGDGMLDFIDDIGEDVEVELCVPVDECADGAMDLLDILDDIVDLVIIEELDDDDDDDPITTAITEEVEEELIDTAAMVSFASVEVAG